MINQNSKHFPPRNDTYTPNGIQLFRARQTPSSTIIFKTFNRFSFSFCFQLSLSLSLFSLCFLCNLSLSAWKPHVTLRFLLQREKKIKAEIFSKFNTNPPCLFPSLTHARRENDGPRFSDYTLLQTQVVPLHLRVLSVKTFESFFKKLVNLKITRLWVIPFGALFSFMKRPI